MFEDGEKKTTTMDDPGIEETEGKKKIGQEIGLKWQARFVGFLKKFNRKAPDQQSEGVKV